MQRLSLALAALTLAVAPRAHAALRVVTTVETFKAITEEIGGKDVSVMALVGPNVDPHFVDPRPSFALELNKADLLIFVGLDLEIGWLPPLVDQARSSRIQPGQPGSLDASTCGISVRDAGGSTSRSQGDIHPMGNPHYWLPPDSALKIARCITDRLKSLDAKDAPAFEHNYGELARKMAEHQRAWEERAKGLRGTRVVTYHKSWTYLMAWLGLNEIGNIEPKPGVPPDPQHLAQLVGQMKSQQAKCVIVETFYPRATANKVAQLAGANVALVSSDAGGPLRSYWDLVDAAIAELTTKCR